MKANRRRFGVGNPAIYAVAAGLAAAATVRFFTRRAERANPPQGRFMDVGGTRVHYIERGQGQPLVLLHGRGFMLQDLELSGLLDLAAEHYRVVAFDRPGYGHSSYPPNGEWDPQAQAKLFREALRQLNVDRPIVLAHSWATTVAIAMALESPEYVRGLVLLAGYYYPRWRPEVALSAATASPVLGHALRYTLSPLLGRALWPLLVKRVFSPAPVPPPFSKFSAWMALRPSQLLADSIEGALLPSVAAKLRQRYRDLTLPVVVVAGEADRYISTTEHSVRLHAELPNSELMFIDGAGHMLHHVGPQNIIAAVEAAERRAVLQPGAADADRRPTTPLGQVTNAEAGTYWTGH